MRAAQEAVNAKLLAEIAMKEKALQDQKNAKNRGHMAIAKERRLMDEKKKLEEEVKQIERKK